MHPEVRSPQPGSCPKCGMALVPVAGAGEADDSELRDLTRRLWIGVALSIPLVVLAMSPMIGIHDPFGIQPRPRGWIEFVLGTPVVLWVGWPILRKFWFSLVHRALNMYTLIGLGVALAYAVQPRCGAVARSVSAGFPRARRCGRHLFRGGGGDRDPGDPRRRSAVASDGTDQSGDSTIAEARAQPRLAFARRRDRGTGAVGECHRRRSAAGEAGREGAGGRHGTRGRESHRRIHDHRRARAGGQGRGQQGHRRNREWQWLTGHPRRAGGRGYAAGTHRSHGGRSAAHARADPAARRYHRGVLRPDRGRHRHRNSARVVVFRSGAEDSRTRF